jgi:diguanylate cyclase (GGDEF)-like protein
MQFQGSHLESWRPVILMSALALVGSIVFTAIDLVTREWSTAVVTGTLSILLAGLLYLIRRASHLAAHALFGVTAAGAFLILFAIFHLHLAGLFWAYPLLCISYFILGSGRASILMCIFCPVVVYGAWHWTTREEFPRVIGSLALTWIFALIFSTDNERQHAEMERLAARDPLTGAANRREMEKEIERAVSFRIRYKTPASIVLFDLDHFKTINDVRGHDVGDTVLIEMVAAVSARLRKSDRLFRIGGEEFVVLLPYSRLNDAYVLAECMRNMVQSNTFAELTGITISLGVAELEPGEPALDCLRRADEALYRAKELGRNQTVRAIPRLAEIPVS